MVKFKKTKTPLQERAALRVNEQRRMEHAFEVLYELTRKHMEQSYAEVEIADLYRLRCQLENKIKNQHIRDEDYRHYKEDQSIPEGF